jgi:hypothetical protein
VLRVAEDPLHSSNRRISLLVRRKLLPVVGDPPVSGTPDTVLSR